ncbi:MAG TPA: hypothetical protein EYQ31_05675 [Candidatus Handelsmanbacteria bacterium]|nr:hypothetical protein [Candidatus Handelsmanbacteria bacterium]
MRIRSVLWGASICTLPIAASAQGFYDFWGDGQAEVSSYKVVQPRYGEERTGYGVMIFVTEDVNRNTLIKVESPTPERDRIYTLKLNSILKFTTGIYDYSVMTSVFSAVEPLTQSQPFELLKLNLSSQEWCGHVFEEVRIDDGRLRGDLNSYFESEGRQEWSFDRPQEFASEDHLLIRLRELKGTFMDEGESRQMTLLPSLWQFRIRHAPRELVEVTLTKGFWMGQMPVNHGLWESVMGNNPSVTGKSMRRSPGRGLTIHVRRRCGSTPFTPTGSSDGRVPRADVVN